VNIWDVREALRGVHSKFTRALFCPWVSYKLNRAPIPIDFLDCASREPECPPHQTKSTLLSLSLVSCCVLFPFTGIFKVRGTVHVIQVSSKNARPSLEYGHLLVHDLDRYRMPDTRRQLDRMEQEHGQQGSDLL
jgi:hypothetical protein